MASWGEIIEVESHFDIDITRWQQNQKPGLPQDGAFYGPGAHTMDQIRFLLRPGRPGSRQAYDIRKRLRGNKANPTTTFEAQLFYGDLNSHRQNTAIWENRLSEILSFTVRKVVYSNTVSTSRKPA